MHFETNNSTILQRWFGIPIGFLKEFYLFQLPKRLAREMRGAFTINSEAPVTYTAKFRPATGTAACTLAVRALRMQTILDFEVANATMTDAIGWLYTRMVHQIPTRVAFLNAHRANLSAGDAANRAALNSADVILPDGSGVALPARLLGQPLAANLNRTDLRRQGRLIWINPVRDRSWYSTSRCHQSVNSRLFHVGKTCSLWTD
jgi:hypothetical protein